MHTFSLPNQKTQYCINMRIMSIVLLVLLWNFFSIQQAYAQVEPANVIVERGLPEVLKGTKLVIEAVTERTNLNGAVLASASTANDAQIQSLMKLLNELIAIYTKLLAEQQGNQSASEGVYKMYITPLVGSAEGEPYYNNLRITKKDALAHCKSYAYPNARHIVGTKIRCTWNGDQIFSDELYNSQTPVVSTPYVAPTIPTPTPTPTPTSASCPGTVVPLTATSKVVTARAYGAVYGNGPYFTSDSNLSTIARYLGAPEGTSATLSVTGVECEPSFASGSRNGVTTYSYGSWQGMRVTCTNGCSGTAPSTSVTYSCTGTVPPNASAYGGANLTGLTANTSYIRSGSNTAGKCEFDCNADGHVWNGSACVFPNTPVQTAPPPTTTTSCPGTPVSSGTQVVTASAYGGTVWGSGPYFTADSNLSVIARFLGAPEGGTATLSVTSLGCQSTYDGSTKNNVTTYSYGSYQGKSVSCTNGCSGVVQAPPPTTASCPGTDVSNGTQTVTANASGGMIWGNGPFTADSNLSAIARYLGAPQGGSATLSVTNLGCQSSYSSGTQNTVTTLSYGSYKGKSVSCTSGCSGSSQTSTTIPSAPPAFTASCVANGTSLVTTSFATPGATYYQVRVDGQTSSFNPSFNNNCTPANAGDTCNNNFTGTTYTGSAIVNNYYDMWVHACNANGCSPAATHSNYFRCLAN